MTPFREADLEAQVAALRQTRDDLAARVELVRAEARALAPWSWWRFGLGVAIPAAGTFALLAAWAVVAVLVSR